MTGDVKISVLSPEFTREKLEPGQPPPGIGGPGGPPGGPQPDPAKISLADRLDNLDNKTLYLVDIGFGGGLNFMLEVQKWFNENMPSVKTIARRKPGMVFADDNNELWDEVKKEGDAVILGVGG